jgi:M6 family metalloprotease-like protein/uncharacterized repeat protein (TIGR02543 family)
MFHRKNSAFQMLQSILRKVPIVLLLLLVIVPYVPGFAASKSSISQQAEGNFTFPLPAPPIVSSATQLAPIKGTLRVLVVAAQFSDINATVSINQLKQEWGQVNQYYQEASYGAVTLQIDVFGWYKLPQVEAYYGRDCLAIDDADCSGSDSSWMVARDAAQLAQHDANFNNYDYFAFVHSGYGQESSSVTNDIWSVTYLGGVYVQTQVRTITRFSIDPELEARGGVPTGVYAHEFGHQIGLPDLYNTQNGQTILGPWTLMDAGLWNGNPPGSSPAHLDAWCKTQLGWISGQTLAVVSSAAVSNYTIDPTEVASSNIHAVKVPIPNGITSRYYLVEVRQKIGFDSGLPSVGVLILYVDETLTVGELKIMNANPSVSNLKAATWSVGQTFNDAQNNITIAVVGQVGNSYQVKVGHAGTVQPPNQNQNYVQLSITRIFSQPNVITLPNTTVTVFIDISNVGTQSATNALVEVDLDGQQYTTTSVNVAAGSTTETSFTWKSVVGSHAFRVVIDPYNTLNEPNRTGNVATFTLNVGPILTINVPVNVTSNGTTIWVKINGVQYNLNSSQLQTSVPSGTVTIEIEPAVNTSLGARQAFSGWSDGYITNPVQILITNNTQITALFRSQYLLTVNQNQGTTSPGDWYNASSLATITANPTSNEIPNVTRLIFSNWSGDYNSTSTSLTINMTKPVTVQANWIHQYYVTIISSTGSPSGAGWYNAGSTANIIVQPIIEFLNGTREVFTGWNVTTLAQAPNYQFNVTSPTRLQAIWKIQYLIQAESPYGTPTGSGWYDTGSLAPVAIQPQITYDNKTRRVFTGWTGDYASTSPNFTLTANKPMNITAQWKTQFEITFKVSGIPNSTYVTLNVNNADYPVTVNQPYSAWYDEGQTLDPTANQTVMSYFQLGDWHNSTGGSVAKPMTVNGPQDYTAAYSPTLPVGIPGFPVESILIGMAAGLFAVGFAKRRRRTRKFT